VGYSFYEIYITSQRAFSAMGFPHGSDEDAAFIISWLELNNFRGVSLLANSIKELDQKYQGILDIEDLSKTINFKDVSILMKGSGLIDFMLSKTVNKKKISVKIVNCKKSILFLPLLYKISKKINYITLSFCDSNNKLNTYELKNKKIIIKNKKNNKLLQNNEVIIEMQNNKENMNNMNNNKVISEKEIQKNLSRSLEPEVKSWNKITKIANKTFVPESEESRNKGAGGGDAND
tara:strand:+ start:717 stop:1418 length:702 start_codon:yes stop_codon:yes gene_type:complete